VITLIFDTETTGLNDFKLMPANRQPYVIQFSGSLVDLDTGKIENTYTTFIRPPRQELLTAKITEITDITWDNLEEAPPFFSVAGKIALMIRRAECVAAHNLSFDMAMLDLEAGRMGKKITWPETRICSVEATVHLKGYNLDLIGLHTELFGKGFDKAHTADADTAALVKCMIEMRKRNLI
jgi:DNA polymerase III epsilon subunit-like protein